MQIMRIEVRSVVCLLCIMAVAGSLLTKMYEVSSLKQALHRTTHGQIQMSIESKQLTGCISTLVLLGQSLPKLSPRSQPQPQKKLKQLKRVTS
jgi:hypothetical protein